MADVSQESDWREWQANAEATRAGARCELNSLIKSCLTLKKLLEPTDLKDNDSGVPPTRQPDQDLRVPGVNGDTRRGDAARRNDATNKAQGHSWQSVYRGVESHVTGTDTLVWRVTTPAAEGGILYFESEEEAAREYDRSFLRSRQNNPDTDFELNFRLSDYCDDADPRVRCAAKPPHMHAHMPSTPAEGFRATPGLATPIGPLETTHRPSANGSSASGGAHAAQHAQQARVSSGADVPTEGERPTHPTAFADAQGGSPGGVPTGTVPMSQEPSAGGGRGSSGGFAGREKPVGGTDDLGAQTGAVPSPVEALNFLPAFLREIHAHAASAASSPSGRPGRTRERAARWETPQAGIATSQAAAQAGDDPGAPRSPPQGPRGDAAATPVRNARGADCPSVPLDAGSRGVLPPHGDAGLGGGDAFGGVPPSGAVAENGVKKQAGSAVPGVRSPSHKRAGKAAPGAHGPLPQQETPRAGQETSVRAGPNPGEGSVLKGKGPATDAVPSDGGFTSHASEPCPWGVARQNTSQVPPGKAASGQFQGSARDAAHQNVSQVPLGKAAAGQFQGSATPASAAPTAPSEGAANAEEEVPIIIITSSDDEAQEERGRTRAGVSRSGRPGLGMGFVAKGVPRTPTRFGVKVKPEPQSDRAYRAKQEHQPPPDGSVVDMTDGSVTDDVQDGERPRTQPTDNSRMERGRQNSARRVKRARDPLFRNPEPRAAPFSPRSRAPDKSPNRGAGTSPYRGANAHERSTPSGFPRHAEGPSPSRSAHRANPHGAWPQAEFNHPLGKFWDMCRNSTLGGTSVPFSDLKFNAFPGKTPPGASPRSAGRGADMLGRNPKGPGAFARPDAPPRSGRANDEWVENVDMAEPAARPSGRAGPNQPGAPAAPAGSPARPAFRARRVVRRANPEKASAQPGGTSPVGDVPGSKASAMERGAAANAGTAPVTQPTANKAVASDVMEGRHVARQPAEGGKGGKAGPGQPGAEAAGGTSRGKGEVGVAPANKDGEGRGLAGVPSANVHAGVKRAAEAGLGEGSDPVSPQAFARSIAGAVPELGREAGHREGPEGGIEAAEWEERRRVIELQNEEARREKKRRKQQAELEARAQARLENHRQQLALQDSEEEKKSRLRVQVRAMLQRQTRYAKGPLRLLLALKLPVEGGMFATDAQVTAALRKARLKFHPDRYQSAELAEQINAEETFKLLSEHLNGR